MHLLRPCTRNPPRIEDPLNQSGSCQEYHLVHMKNQACESCRKQNSHLHSAGHPPSRQHDPQSPPAAFLPFLRQGSCWHLLAGLRTHNACHTGSSQGWLKVSKLCTPIPLHMALQGCFHAPTPTVAHGKAGFANLCQVPLALSTSWSVAQPHDVHAKPLCGLGLLLGRRLGLSLCLSELRALPMCGACGRLTGFLHNRSSSREVRTTVPTFFFL